MILVSSPCATGLPEPRAARVSARAATRLAARAQRGCDGVSPRAAAGAADAEARVPR